MPFQLDSEVAAALGAIFGAGGPPPAPPVGDVKSRREGLSSFLDAMKATAPSCDDVSQTDFYAKTTDGHDLLLRWYSKTGAALKDSPAVIYFHGGGMIALSALQFDKAIHHRVHETGVPFLSVEYRLAPEFPAPTAVTDAYTALEWLHSNASKLGVDPTRIAIMGESGGGGIAASLAHFASKRNGPKISKQILIYPMLDDRNTIPDESLVPFMVWSYNDNQTAWDALLGARCGKDGVLPEEAAARMTLAEAKGLPTTYIDVGELDIFRDEDIEYAKKLTLAGVSTELHIWPKVPHAWEVVAPNAEVSKRAIANRLKAIMSI